MSKITQRIEDQAGVPGLAELLADRLTPTDLQSLLLEVYRQRAEKRSPADVLTDYDSNRFVRPSSVSPVMLTEWERTAFSVLPAEFEAMTLSPVAPLGASSVVGGVDQNWAVSTSRTTEVVSDSTNVLALEDALRRRQLLRADGKSPTPVHLAASHRLLRPQFFGDAAYTMTHFNIFALCSAGRIAGNLGFELATLGLHMRIYLNALRAFLGPDVPLRITLTDFSEQDRHPRLEEELLTPIRDAIPNTTCEFEDDRTMGKGYYVDLCFHVFVQDAGGAFLEVGDGGVVDWAQKLLSNAKERMVISGTSGERICMMQQPD